MREYQGKRKDNGEWIKGSLIIGINYCCILQSEKEIHPMDYPYLDGDMGTFDGKATPVIPETVRQCIGVFDKYNKEISEGDIIKFHKFNNEPDWVGVVEFDCAMYIVRGNNQTNRFEVQISAIDKSTIEIIGNKYDNPELLSFKNIKIWVDDRITAPNGYIGLDTVNKVKNCIIYEEEQGNRIEIINCRYDLGYERQADGGNIINLFIWLYKTGRNYPIHIHSMDILGKEHLNKFIHHYHKEVIKNE